LIDAKKNNDRNQSVSVERNSFDATFRNQRKMSDAMKRAWFAKFVETISSAPRLRRKRFELRLQRLFVLISSDFKDKKKSGDYRIMRLTAELISFGQVFMNPLRERQLSLRGKKSTQQAFLNVQHFL
jgi:hypothetical protein